MPGRVLPLLGLRSIFQLTREFSAYSGQPRSGLVASHLFAAQWRILAAPGDISVLWTIFAILLILWLLGWGFHVAGSLIHLLLVLAIIVAIISLVTGRRTV